MYPLKVCANVTSSRRSMTAFVAHDQVCRNRLKVVAARALLDEEGAVVKMNDEPRTVIIYRSSSAARIGIASLGLDRQPEGTSSNRR